jgi:branched-chain amino acid transport system substrate-binding protein
MFRTYFVFILIFLLGACGMQNNGVRTSPFDPYVRGEDNGQMMPVDRDQSPTLQQPVTQATTIANGKVAILLPLSGPQAQIGQSMLEAAQLALFDVNDSGFELLPFDTQGTTSGTTKAVNDASAQGAKLVLGPLLANNVQAAGLAARRSNLQVIGFTTDATKVSGNVSTLGILPFDQGNRMANYAQESGLNRIAIIDPNTSYSRAVITAFESKARSRGIQVVTKASPSNAVQTLSAKQGQFNAIFMPVGNPQLAALSRTLTENGMASNLIPWLGVGLWDDAAIQGNPTMSGAIYAAPTQHQRINFDRQYQSIYGKKPQRLASLAYDATALSIVLLRQNNRFIDRNAIMNPNGFAGIDGIFRFQSNGLAERGLAVHRIVGRGRTAIIDQAPSSFLTQTGANYR